MVNNWLVFIQTTLFPRRCLLCGADAGDLSPFCGDCHSDLPWNRHACTRCALPLPAESSPGSQCGRCQRHPPPFERVIAPLRYAPPIDRLIAEHKFRGRLASGPPLAQLLADEVRHGMDRAPDLLLPAPLHPVGLRRRGFNQTAELARRLSRQLTIPWSPDILEKTLETLPQHGLERRLRRRNLRHAFACRQSLTGLRIALIDDIMTTGSTATEISRVLLQAGAAAVEIWVVARTPGQRT